MTFISSCKFILFIFASNLTWGPNKLGQFTILRQVGGWWVINRIASLGKMHTLPLEKLLIQLFSFVGINSFCIAITLGQDPLYIRSWKPAQLLSDFLGFGNSDQFVACWSVLTTKLVRSIFVLCCVERVVHLMKKNNCWNLLLYLEKNIYLFLKIEFWHF